ncbi:MAG: hypothetical protein ACI90Z_002286, partial [Cyanobium sp.]
PCAALKSSLEFEQLFDLVVAWDGAAAIQLRMVPPRVRASSS